MQFNTRDNEPNCTNTQSTSAEAKTTRSTQEKFDSKTCCFICGEVCDNRREENASRLNRSWSLVETAIDSDIENICTKVYKAAERKQDNVILQRLRSVVNGDLVAIEQGIIGVKLVSYVTLMPVILQMTLTHHEDAHLHINRL